MTSIDRKAYKVVPLITADELQVRIASLAEEIARKAGKEITVIALLKGAFIFTADLIRALHKHGVAAEVAFVTLSSYRDGTQSSGTISMPQDLLDDISGKQVLILDDILESGRTLDYACRLVEARGAASVHTAVLLEKPGKRAVDRACDFIGFAIPDSFVIGYGLDYAGHYRELPFIGVLEEK